MPLSPGAELNHRAEVTRAGVQSIADSTITAISFDTVTSDPFSMYSGGSPTRLTALVAGTYMVTGSVQFASNATGERQIRIHANGTVIMLDGRAAISGNVTRAACSTLVTLAAGGYVELQVYQTSGGALDVSVATNSPIFKIALISRS